MSLEQATEIVKDTDDCTCDLCEAWRIVIAHHRQREKEAREAALDMAQKLSHVTFFEQKLSWLEAEEYNQGARATIRKFGDRNGME